MRGVEQAVILAGGRGERLKPLTDSIPKPMVKVAGKPFLEHLILLLKRNGIKNFLFLTGYLGSIIEDYFENGSKFDVTIDYSFDEPPRGTGGALSIAEEKLSHYFFLLFGDSYLPIDYGRMASKFVNDRKKVMLSVYDNKDDTDVPFNIKLDQDKKVIASYKKGKNNPVSYNYCDAGVLIVNKNTLEFIEGKGPVSFEEAVYPRLISEMELGYYVAECRFYDIGTLDRLKTFEKYILEKEKA